MSKPTLFILCGEAFSGKSTISKELAEKYNANILGRDALYFQVEKLLNLENTSEDDDENLWSNLWPVVLLGVKNHLTSGNSVVFDDNCFFFRQREDLRIIAKEIGIESILVYLDTPFDIIKKRKEENKIKNTRHDVPSSWIDEDAKIFERPSEIEFPIVVKSTDSIEEVIRKLQERII